MSSNIVANLIYSVHQNVTGWDCKIAHDRNAAPPTQNSPRMVRYRNQDISDSLGEGEGSSGDVREKKMRV